MSSCKNYIGKSEGLFSISEFAGVFRSVAVAPPTWQSSVWLWLKAFNGSSVHADKVSMKTREEKKKEKEKRNMEANLLPKPSYINNTLPNKNSKYWYIPSKQSNLPCFTFLYIPKKNSTLHRPFYSSILIRHYTNTRYWNLKEKPLYYHIFKNSV